MTTDTTFEIFLAAAPGLEPVLCEEVRGKGFRRPRAVPGGVVIEGGWPEVWRANLWIRGAGRVLARLDQFRVVHLAQLDQRARRVPWASVLRPDRPFRVEATCAASRIWHSGAAAQRIATAIRETLGAPEAEAGGILVRARLEHDLCTISVDTSGEPLHKRGYKEAVNPAPMRETLASLFLMQCGYAGTEPLLDPMCGAGTFVIEAAEIAARLNPGRARRFAFEDLASFDAEAWARMRAVQSRREPAFRCFGSDRDAGAVEMSRANAARAGVEAGTEFRQATISDAAPPEGPPGLVIVNPPYGARLGEGKALGPLYRALGQVLRARFSGWRVGLVTAEPRLAQVTGLPFLPPGPPVPHGGLRVTLYRTAPLA
ncbi:THUMP domain-containing class I SAM-dependent RNA methyltransferase [Paracraurococcus lichenis]|uniref:Class I SAM-dependent RNA methyltransferase n=1 Tax=Paracraurococcus lichenis TaxID=3064888 RepID=A0ABT9DZQ3_9PROT|nr:class I SAM-dependent RNA methyltransferase [Paracraurococcus sp. LOR1-02]MDO9709397.1 class I SAM-dependent RNA methyltransferase [Paracraurococcus sp. LOR1-02]